MFQITFSQQSLNQLGALPFIEKKDAVLALAKIDLRSADPEGDLKHFKRDQKDFYRYRHKDLRVYLERPEPDRIHAHCILSKNTFQDFIFRCKLPHKEEALVEEHYSFWDYLQQYTQSSEKAPEKSPEKK